MRRVGAIATKVEKLSPRPGDLVLVQVLGSRTDVERVAKDLAGLELAFAGVRFVIVNRALSVAVCPGGSRDRA